jgi:cell division protease FtsH
VLLGGRAAELLVFGEVSTGAADDLQKVTSIARSIVMRFGMHEQLGNVVYDSDKSNFLGQNAAPPQERNYSEETAREIDCAVRQIVAHAFSRSSAILGERREILEETARDLLARETLDEADLKAIHARVTNT